MRTIGKLVALFYGSQMLLAGIGMGLFCYLSPTAFAASSKETGINLRLFMLTAGLIPQVGLGLLLVWIGLPSRVRMRSWRAARTTVKQILEN